MQALLGPDGMRHQIFIFIRDFFLLLAMTPYNRIQFYTATNLFWHPVLKNDYHKDILIEAIKHRVDKGHLIVYAFVIMPNHFHALWHIIYPGERYAFQRDLLKFTARSILAFMMLNNDPLMRKLYVGASDRQYQVWERNSLSVDVISENVFIQKLNYIHNNPVQEKWRLCTNPSEYRYSSAGFYEHLIDTFGILTHFRD
jgi:putative transposase